MTVIREVSKNGDRYCAKCGDFLGAVCDPFGLGECGNGCFTLKAYRVSDYEIYAGWDYESAVAAAMEDSGEKRDAYDREDPGPLPDDYKIMDQDENEKPLGEISVAEIIARDITEPGLVGVSY